MIVALKQVDRDYQNQIYVLPGINEDFSPENITESKEFFVEVGQKNDILILL